MLFLLIWLSHTWQGYVFNQWKKCWVIVLAPPSSCFEWIHSLSAFPLLLIYPHTHTLIRSTILILILPKETLIYDRQDWESNHQSYDCSPEPQPPHVIVLWRRKVCAFEADCFVFCLFASYKNVKLAAFPHLTIKPLFSLGKSLTTRSSTIVLSKQHPQGDQKWFKPPVSCGQDLAMVEL